MTLYGALERNLGGKTAQISGCWLYDKKSCMTDGLSIDTANTIVKHTAHLVMEISQDTCDFRPISVDGIPYYKIWFRARPEWDGLLERWLFMVHRELLSFFSFPIACPGTSKD